MEVDILDMVKERLKSRTVRPEDSEYFQRTDKMYYVPWDIPMSPQSKMSPKKQQQVVECPKFSIKHIPTGYSMEGTEVGSQ